MKTKILFLYVLIPLTVLSQRNKDLYDEDRIDYPDYFIPVDLNVKSYKVLRGVSNDLLEPHEEPDSMDIDQEFFLDIQGRYTSIKNKSIDGMGNSIHWNFTYPTGREVLIELKKVKDPELYLNSDVTIHRWYLKDSLMQTQEAFDYKGDPIYTWDYIYENDTILKHAVKYKSRNKKEIYKWTVHRDSSDLIRKETKMEKNKPTALVIYDRDSLGRVTQELRLTKNKIASLAVITDLSRLEVLNLSSGEIDSVLEGRTAKTRYTYNSKGYLSSLEIIKANGKRSQLTTYFRNALGQISELRFLDESEIEIREQHIYNYFNELKETKYTYYKGNEHRFEGKKVFIYDESNRLLKEQSATNFMGIPVSRTTKYIYEEW